MWLLFPSQDWRQRSPKRETYLHCVQAFEMHLRLTDGVSDCDCTTVSAWQSVLVSGDQYLRHIYISTYLFSINIEKLIYWPYIISIGIMHLSCKTLTPLLTAITMFRLTQHSTALSSAVSLHTLSPDSAVPIVSVTTDPPLPTEQSKLEQTTETKFGWQNK